jgi:hypothetical protein
MNRQLPTAISARQWKGHFQRIEKPGRRDELPPESSGIPDESGFEKRLSERLVGGSNLVGLGLFKTKFVDS